MSLKLNIFKIPKYELIHLKGRLADLNAESIHVQTQNSWTSEFLLLESREYLAPWMPVYRSLFSDRDLPLGINHSAVYIFESDTSCYAITHGIAHFIVRPFCDYDFGIDLAKRIADKADVTQTSARMHQGVRRKEIRSYLANSRLEVQSGESVELIHAGISALKQKEFGTRGRFGTSASLTPDISVPEIGDFLSIVDNELRASELFELPRTVAIREKTQVEYFDNQLIEAVRSQSDAAEFTMSSFDLCGVDFVFGDDGPFSLKAPHKRSMDLGNLSIGDLRRYIENRKLSNREALKIAVTRADGLGGWIDYELKESLDYFSDTHRVVLLRGKWMHFNQDYLKYLDEFISEIEMEPVEECFGEIFTTETAFNSSLEVNQAGYTNADKDFEIAKTRLSTPVEAWDLRKGGTVYALKFGTAQKLGYVCDQASNMLELLSNQSLRKEIPEFDRYCLWFAYEAKNRPLNIADTNSIILKQKIVSWARLCLNLRITPVIKISKRGR